MSEYSKPRRLAGAALHHAINQDWRRATEAVDRLNRECSGDGLWTALVGWCDTFADHANDGMPGFVKTRVAPWNVDTGAVGDAPPERTQWAMDLISARASGDEAAFTALVKRLNDIGDGYERGRYISALLTSISLTMRSLPRGFGRMGGAS